MANADLEAKEKAAAAARAEAEQATAELNQAIAEADQEVKEKAAKAAQAKADTAKNEADKAKTEGQEGQDAKEQAAKEAQAKADTAKNEAEAAKTTAEQAKATAEQAKAEAVRLRGLLPPGPPTAGVLNAVAEHGPTVFKSALGVIALVFLGIIAVQLSPYGNLFDQLKFPETVRGFITFLIALGTIAIAIMLVVAAFSDGSDKTPLKERFDMGNRVLVALIGILGTIVGFYFGSAVPPAEVQVLKVADAKVEGEAKPGGKIKLSFQVTGGKAPYSYTVTFPAKTIALLEGETENGKVSEEIMVPENIKSNTKLTPIKIVVTDKDKKTTTQEMKEPPILIKAQDGAGKVTDKDKKTAAPQEMKEPPILIKPKDEAPPKT
jgi:hypothetical protein